MQRPRLFRPALAVREEKRTACLLAPASPLVSISFAFFFFFFLSELNLAPSHCNLRRGSLQLRRQNSDDTTQHGLQETSVLAVHVALACLGLGFGFGLSWPASAQRSAPHSHSWRVTARSALQRRLKEKAEALARTQGASVQQSSDGCLAILHEPLEVLLTLKICCQVLVPGSGC